MAIEDLTTWTEVDEPGAITVTSTRVTMTTFPTRQQTGLIRKDFGAAFFGDFTQHLTVFMSAFAAPGTMTLWHINNVTGDAAANDSGHGLYLYMDAAAGTFYIYDAETSGFDEFVGSASTPYYLIIARAVDQASVKVYTDAGRTALADTLTATVDTETYRYVKLMASYDDNNGSAGNVSGYAENLDVAPSSFIPFPNPRGAQAGMHRLTGGINE